MKLIRHGASGCEKPGAIDSQGQARDLSDLVPDFTPEWMAPGRLAALSAPGGVWRHSRRLECGVKIFMGRRRFPGWPGCPAIRASS